MEKIGAVSPAEAGIPREDFDIVLFPIGKPEPIRFFIPDHTPIFVTILDAWGRCKTDRLKDLGYPVEILWDDRRKGISSTMIRKAMITGSDRRQYIPSTI